MAFRKLLRNDRVMLGGPFDPSSKSVEKSNVPDDSEMWDPDGCLRNERGSLLNDNLRPDDNRDVYYGPNLVFPLFNHLLLILLTRLRTRSIMRFAGLVIACIIGPVMKLTSVFSVGPSVS